MIQAHDPVVQDTAHAAQETADSAGHALDLGEVILHHTADAWTLELHPFESLPLQTIHLPRLRAGKINFAHRFQCLIA